MTPEERKRAIRKNRESYGIYGAALPTPKPTPYQPGPMERRFFVMRGGIKAVAVGARLPGERRQKRRK